MLSYDISKTNYKLSYFYKQVLIGLVLLIFGFGIGYVFGLKKGALKVNTPPIVMTDKTESITYDIPGIKENTALNIKIISQSANEKLLPHKEGNKLLFFELQIENKNIENILISPADFILKNTINNELTYSTFSSQLQTLSDFNLKPTQKIITRIIFEVPKKEEKLLLLLTNSSIKDSPFEMKLKITQ